MSIEEYEDDEEVVLSAHLERCPGEMWSSERVSFTFHIGAELNQSTIPCSLERMLGVEKD